MSIKLAVADQSVMHLKPRISVIGVGGGGGNAVNNMIAQNLEGVDFVVANTDAQALAHSSSSRKIQLGLQTTQGLGAGARPEIGRLAAEEALEEIERELEGANMVFITAGMGGGTGSGAAPVVARIAKQKGILTIGVVTKPFQFEGKRRYETAELALEDFTQSVDSIIIIPNQNLFRIADKNTTLADAFVMADNVLYAGVRSITDLMMMPGLINLDFADIKSIMEDKGKAIMGTGEADGDNRAVKAAEQALSNPLLDDCSMRGAKGVLINITGGMDITLFEIDEAASRIKEEVDEDANIIFGSSFDETLSGKIRVSIVATGIGENAHIQPKAPRITPKYVEEALSRHIEETITTTNIELNSNLEQFSAVKEEEKEELITLPDDLEEIIDSSEIISFKVEDAQEELDAPQPDVLEEKAFNSFDNLTQSDLIAEMPKASSLFQAIINKNEDLSAESQFSSILSNHDNVFQAKSGIKTTEEEPELFPNHNPTNYVNRRQEEVEELIFNDDDDDDGYTPTLIERVTGFSIAKRNKKKTKERERFQEPISTSFTPDEISEERLNLEIPSFLRRK